MQPWLDLLVKYGWPPLLTIAAVYFFYAQWWPDYIKRRDEADKERREREAKQREQLDRLTSVLESTEKSVAANAHLTEANTKLTEKLVQKIEAMDISVKANGENIAKVTDRVDMLGDAIKQIRAIWIRKGRAE